MLAKVFKVVSEIPMDQIYQLHRMNRLEVGTRTSRDLRKIGLRRQYFKALLRGAVSIETALQRSAQMTNKTKTMSQQLLQTRTQTTLNNPRMTLREEAVTITKFRKKKGWLTSRTILMSTIGFNRPATTTTKIWTAESCLPCEMAGIM